MDEVGALDDMKAAVVRTCCTVCCQGGVCSRHLSRPRTSLCAAVGGRGGRVRAAPCTSWGVFCFHVEVKICRLVNFSHATNQPFHESSFSPWQQRSPSFGRGRRRPLQRRWALQRLLIEVSALDGMKATVVRTCCAAGGCFLFVRPRILYLSFHSSVRPRI